MTIHKNIAIPGSAGKPILLDLYYMPSAQPQPVVIFSHGFKGFKDWGHFNYLAQRFAEAGCVFVKFNFSHNGTTPLDPYRFGDLEAFGNNNFIKELDDLNAVIDWVLHETSIHSLIDASKLGLLGHSRGGAISILKAGEDQRVKRLCTWAAVSNLTDRNKKRTIETWQTQGVIYAKNARTGQDMPLYFQFYENQQANKERLNVNHAVKRLGIPFLIVHGTKDHAVNYTDALEIKRSSPLAQLLTIEGADHTFGVKHPFEDDHLPLEAEQVLSKTIQFFKE